MGLRRLHAGFLAYMVVQELLHLAVWMVPCIFMHWIMRGSVIVCSESLALINLGFQSNYCPAFFKHAYQGPIKDIAFEPMYRRLARVGQGSLQVWVINKDCELHQHPAWNHTESVQIPSKKSICLWWEGHTSPEVYSFVTMAKLCLYFFIESHKV